MAADQSDAKTIVSQRLSESYLRYFCLVWRVDELRRVVIDVRHSDNDRYVAFLARRSDRTRNLQFTSQSYSLPLGSFSGTQKNIMLQLT